MIKELKELLDIIWGTEDVSRKKKFKRPRDKKGRFVKYKI
jgi:hypothetical protein